MSPPPTGAGPRRFVLTDETDQPGFDPAPQSGGIDFAALLNPQQLAAVQTTEGPVLVVAGAGTGKTRTLIYRTAFLLERGVDPRHIVLLTFTRRAARQMLERVATLLADHPAGRRASEVRGGTFHAFAVTVLRRHGERLGLSPRFTILDSADAEEVVSYLRTALGLDGKEKRFPRADTLFGFLSASRNRGVEIGDLVADEAPQFLPHLAAIRDLAERYAAYKRSQSLLDYDDLLAHLRELLVDHPDIREHVGREVRYLMVDEYQDTNPVQAELVALLSSVHGNVLAVGDDAQAIYAFRGATVRNILDFAERFPGARVLKLEENYRSTQPILTLANAVLQQAKEGYPKALFAHRDDPDAELPAVVSAPDERYQSRFVCQLVLQMREEGVGLNEMAVLVRNGRNSFDLEVELNRRRIPFVKYGGQKFVEAAHIKDVLAHLRIAQNPRDSVAWNRALLLVEGVGPKSVADILKVAEGVPAAAEFVGKSGAVPPPYMSQRYRSGLLLLAETLKAVADPDRPLVERLKILFAYYQPILERKFADDFPKRQKDLDAFAGLAETYADLESLLTELVLDPVDRSAVETRPGEADDRKDEERRNRRANHRAETERRGDQRHRGGTLHARGARRDIGLDSGRCGRSECAIKAAEQREGDERRARADPAR